MFSRRPMGISVLLAAQNEEHMLELSAKSFLDYADEIIIVSNKSSDRTNEIGHQLASQSKRITFLTNDSIEHLHENRNLALSRSKYRFVFKGDADFVACPELGALFDQARASRPGWPKTYIISHVNLSGDLKHTGVPDYTQKVPRNFVTRFNPAPPAITYPTPRLFECIPGFRFIVSGRWERGSFHRFYKKVVIREPLFFHCSLKSDLSYFMRSERSNWREQGDFGKYPELEVYIKDVVLPRYGVETIEEAKKIYLEECFYPCHIPYDFKGGLKWPDFAKKFLAGKPQYRFIFEDGKIVGRVLQ